MLRLSFYFTPNLETDRFFTRFHFIQLSFLSRQARNTTVHAAMDSQLWKLDAEALRALENDSPDTFGELIKMLLRVTGEEQDCLMSYLVSRLS